MADEPLPTPPTEDSPVIDQSDLTDISSTEESKPDPIAEELTKPDKPEDEKPVIQQKESTQEQPKQEAVTPQEKIVEQIAQKIEQPQSESQVEELKKQLEFYEMLYGGQPQQQQQVQQPQQQTPQPQQPQVPQQPNLLDNVSISQEELIGLLSGEPERAIPIIKKFVATAIVLGQQHQMQQQRQQQLTERYFNGIQEAFYSKEKYADLNDYRPLVKFAGDQIQQEYAARGIFKMPHQCIDDIGKRARELKAKMLGGTNNTPNKVIPKQGEVGDIKNSPPPKQNLSDQQKEMFDLLEDK